MSNALPLPPRPRLEEYEKVAVGLQEARGRGAVREWVERLVSGVGAEQIERRWDEWPDLERSLAGARLFIAREHGFANWDLFAAHVGQLAREESLVSAFEEAVDAVVAGDAMRLSELLRGSPELARARSTREHRSTLLHYVSANGVEDYRQKTPPNIVEIAELLLDAGAEVDAESDAYGGGYTTLGLVATSVHPERAGVQIAMLRMLLDRGADLSGGNGDSIVRACIANGQPVAARYLADLGAPLDAETAAAVGRLDVLKSYFEGLHGEMDWKQVGSGLFYACGYGQLDAATYLLDQGLDPAMRNDDGQTALHWATWTPQIGAIKLLLERGTPVETRDLRFEATALDMALWTWDNASLEEYRERCYEAVALLARAGALLDREHWGGAGSEMLEKVEGDPRMLAALQGEREVQIPT